MIDKPKTDEQPFVNSNEQDGSIAQFKVRVSAGKYARAVGGGRMLTGAQIVGTERNGSRLQSRFSE